MKTTILLTLAVFTMVCTADSSPEMRLLTFHVAPAGSDANPGTQALPWATLQHAADTVAPGDTVLVQNGNYTGFRLDTSGTPGGVITFQAAGNNVVIDAPASTGNGIRLHDVSHVTVDGFTVTGMAEFGIANRGSTATAPSFNITIRNNTVLNTDTVGIYVSQGHSSLIETNTVSGSQSHAIYLSNAGSDNTTLRGNELFNSVGAGIHFNGDLSIGGDGIISGVVVENNHIHDNNHNGLNMDGVQDAVIRNNLIHDNASSGIRMYTIDGAQGPSNMTIVNNTIDVPASGNWCIAFSEDLGGHTIFNNILMNENASTGAIRLESPATPNVSSNYNVAVNRFSNNGGASMLTLAQWNGLGFDLNSQISTPGQEFASGNYNLNATATAVDFGVSPFNGVSAPANDKDGDPRVGATDAGADEFGSTGGGSTGGGTSGGGGHSSSSSGCGAGFSTPTDGLLPLLVLLLFVSGIRRARRH